MDLVKTVIYNCLAFSCVTYCFVVTCLNNRGYDAPSANIITKNIKDCSVLVCSFVRRILQSIVFYTLEFDLWSSLKKDLILGIIIHFLQNGNRVSIVLDTLPLQDETSHAAPIY